jgi:hypothetical protein
MQILATDPTIQTCLTEHFLAFATARETDETAKAQANLVGAEYQRNGSTLPAMISAVSETALLKQIVAVAPTTVESGGQP